MACCFSQMTDGCNVMRTPFEFSSPSMAPSAKRRATDRAESPNKKSALDVSLTPQVVRNKSVSIKVGCNACGKLIYQRLKYFIVTITGPI